jgi:hypothetical protein
MVIRTMGKISVAREHEIQHFEGFVLFEGVSVLLFFGCFGYFAQGGCMGLMSRARHLNNKLIIKI